MTGWANGDAVQNKLAHAQARKIVTKIDKKARKTRLRTRLPFYRASAVL